MEMKSLTSITQNPHFNAFAALFSVAISANWRMRHPEVPDVRSTLDRLARLSRNLLKDATSIRNSFIHEITILLVQIVEADPKLHYSTEDLNWMFELLDGESGEARMILSMLFASAVSPRNFLTVEQVAEITGDGASTWRARAANGEIIGAWKAGKTWMFPLLSLKAYGVNIDRSSLKFEEVTEGE